MSSSRTNRKLAEPWFAINKSIYDGILDVALADVLTPPMTSSVIPVSTTNCSELLKLLNDNEDVKPGDFGTKHHVTAAGTNEFTIKRDVSPDFDAASGRRDINQKTWNNSTVSDNMSVPRERGTGPDLHPSALVPRIHSPSRDCFSTSRLNRRSMLSRSRNSPANLSTRSNSNRMNTKSKRSQINQEVNCFNQSQQPICPPLSAAEFEMNEIIVGDLNPSVKSACRSDRFTETSYTKCHRKAPLVSAPRTITHKELNEKKKKKSTARRQTHFDERAKRNSTTVMELSPMKGRSKVSPKMSIISQGIEDSNNRPVYTLTNSTNTKKDIAYNSQENDCYPLDLTISNLAEASSLVLQTKVPRGSEELNNSRQPETMSQGRKTTKEQTIVGTTHVDVPSDPAKVCWTKVEKDTLLKVVERLSITCLAEDTDIERSQTVAATNKSDSTGDLIHSNKVQTLLSVSTVSLKPPTIPFQMPSPMNDIKTNITKRSSYDMDSEATPSKSVKLLSDSYDTDSSDERVTSPSTSVNVVKGHQNNDSLYLSPTVKNIYKEGSLRSSPVKDAKLIEVRTSRKRVHFNELQPCATSEEHSQGFYKRSNIPTKQDRSVCSSSKLSRSVQRDSGHHEIEVSSHPEKEDTAYSEKQVSTYIDSHDSVCLENQLLPLQIDTKDSIIGTEQHNTLLSDRNQFLSQCSDSALKTCHDIYLTTCKDSTSENLYPSATYENIREDDHHRVTRQKLFSPESYTNTLRDHCLNTYETDYKNSNHDSGQDAYLRTSRSVTKRNNSNIHQRVVIRVEDTGGVSQQFWAAVDKTIVSNMVDQILTNAVNGNSHAGDERYLFEHRDHHAGGADGSATREMNYYRSAEAVWQHFHDFNDSQHVVGARARKVSVKAARRNDVSRDEDASNDSDNTTCDVIEPGLGVVDSESTYEGQCESGTTEGHSTFKWKSNILKRVRIDQIMTSPAPISDWRRSPNVASPVAV